MRWMRKGGSGRGGAATRARLGIRPQRNPVRPGCVEGIDGMLRRAPDASGFSHWVDYLDRRNTGLALIDGFLAAPEYRLRFLP